MSDTYTYYICEFSGPRPIKQTIKPLLYLPACVVGAAAVSLFVCTLAGGCAQRAYDVLSYTARRCWVMCVCALCSQGALLPFDLVFAGDSGSRRVGGGNRAMLICARAQPRLRNSCECHIAQARSSALHRNPIKITSTCLRRAQNPVVRVRVRHHKLEHTASAHAVCGCLSIHTTPWFAPARLRCAEHFVCKLCAKNGRAQHLWLLSSRRTQKHYARGVCNAI